MSIIDGGGLQKLVERNVGVPALIPDDQTVVYAPHGPGLYRVPLTGGLPQKISDRDCLRIPAVSSDGRLLMFLTTFPNRVLVCEMPDCARPREITLPDLKDGEVVAGLALKWVPGKRAIAFFPPKDRFNIWEQSIDGGPARQITRLADLPIWEFRWSPDGRHLVLSRGRYLSDMVLIKGLQ